jgi:broad specificity phosphatase PhoE
MPPPTIYYIRHGETDWNVTGRLHGRHDVPLNARGRAQANHCGNILRDRFAQIGRHPADFDYVSSPLGRACETMALARPPLGLPPEGFRNDQRLAEICFGDWEGFTIAELRNRDLNALPPANMTNGILCRRAEKVTSPSRCECANGMRASRATL